MIKMFAFGCSFTDYTWPTWADILGVEYGYYENWGKCGAGNQYIFNSLIEASNHISKNDHVYIMWTTVVREDRWRAGRWWTPGSIYNQNIYDDGYVKYVDPTGNFIRDCYLIRAARIILEKIGCKYTFMSMMPLDQFKEYSHQSFLDNMRNELRIRSNKRKYAYEFKSMKPSVFETVFNSRWLTRKKDLFTRQSLDSLDLSFEKWKTVKGADWPTWESMITMNLPHIPAFIMDEICSMYDAPDWNTFINEKMYISVDVDQHPTPILHLEYLQKVLDVKLSDATIQKVHQSNTNLHAGLDCWHGFNNKHKKNIR